MSIEKVKQYFKQLGIENRINEFEVSSATVELAAKALNVNPQRIAKTLSFKKEDKCILIVTAGDMKIDNRKFKDRFEIKAKMLTPEQVKQLVGHEVGGVCPFVIPKDIEVYLDKSLKRFKTIFPACGSNNSTIELTCDELFKYSNAKEWIDVCKQSLA